jgi:hypothetical protein
MREAFGLRVSLAPLFGWQRIQRNLSRRNPMKAEGAKAQGAGKTEKFFASPRCALARLRCCA